ncbi:MAG: hypothetical protein IIA45_00285 [Bacteroidetes bacterium]|nr:hypothetical protein [Bacteroidota bacterium]
MTAEKKVLVCNIVSPHIVSYARKKNFEAILTHGIMPGYDTTTEDFKIIDTNIYRKKGSWRAYNDNKVILDRLKEKFPNLFKHNGYDLTKGLYKHVYWTNYKDGYVKVAVEENELRDAVLVHYHPNFLNRLVRRFGQMVTSGQENKYHKAMRRPLKPLDKIYDVIFFVDSLMTLDNWQFLIREFDPYRTAIYHMAAKSNKILEKRINELPFDVINEGPILSNAPLSYKRNGLIAEEVIMMQQIAGARSKFFHFLREFELLAEACKKSFVVNGFENDFTGNLLHEVAAKKGLYVFNTTNGTRAGNATCADSEFDAFLIWDEKMRTILIEEAKIDSRQVVNLEGHLLEDVMSRHRFSNSLELDLSDIEDKRVITFGSCQGFRKDKIDALDVLYGMLKENKDLVLLYRPHPRETPLDYYLPKDDQIQDRFFLIKYDEENNKTTLYDQLFITDVTVVPTSTVALESSWAGVPAITFEQNDTPLLYCVDEETIFHVKVKDHLADKVNELLQQQPKKNDKEVTNYAKVYADFIKAFEKN